jgi:hypothetical protein
MAKFNVVQPTYRASLLHQPGDIFVVADEELHQHCDSRRRAPASPRRRRRRRRRRPRPRSKS